MKTLFRRLAWPRRKSASDLERGQSTSDQEREQRIQVLERQRDELVARNEILKGRVRELLAKYRDARAGREETDPTSHNSAENMDAFFEDIPDEALYVDFGRALGAALARHRVHVDGLRIADVGTGPGLVLRTLLEGASPALVRGYDFSEAALVHARAALPMGEFRRQDIYEPLDASFDLILCTEVLEHLEHPRRALDTILGALPPGGRMVLTVPDGRIDFSRYHINFWSPESWRVFVADSAPGYRLVFDRFQVRETANYQNNLAIIERPS